MEALMRSAAASGGSDAEVKNRLISSIKDFGYKFHVVGVVKAPHGKRSWLHNKCKAFVRSNGYVIDVYIRK